MYPFTRTTWSVAVLAFTMSLFCPGTIGIANTDRVYEDYTYHPCVRPCTLTTKPMECVYQFYLEYYTTFNKECLDCPQYLSDCFRPSCIPADGNNRVIMTVNKQLPGPAIHVCQNDVVVVRVTNNLLATEGSTIHWHGQHQHGTQYMDGTARVTQCAIPPSASFEYRFPAATPGTHYWHDHSGPARSEGIFGAFVVRQPPELEAHLGLYDLDLPEHTLIVMDWLNKPVTEIFSLDYMGKRVVKETTILVNGRRVEEEFFSSSTNRTGRNFLPMTTFTVQQGMRYRFRVISNGIQECPIQMSIDGHKLTVIASDGSPFAAEVVKSLYVHSGERYDFILHASQRVGNFWMRFQGTEFGCGGAKAYGAAILRYVGAAEEYPVEKFNSYEDATIPGKSLNKWNVPPSADDIQLSSLQGFSVDPVVLKPVPDRKLYLKMRMSIKYTYKMGMSYLNQINDISLLHPPAPPLTQLEDLDTATVCDVDSVGDVNCTQTYCECVYVIKVALGDVVEMIVVDEGIDGRNVHPMHLHGYKYYVVVRAKLGDSTTLEEVKRLDSENKLHRNLATPVAKDTVATIDGGYGIFRWHATNPGFWLYHCHTEFHFLEGQGVIFQVGEPGDWPRAPKRFPRCGDWHFTGFEEGPCPTVQGDGYEIQSASGAAIFTYEQRMFAVVVFVTHVLVSSSQTRI